MGLIAPEPTPAGAARALVVNAEPHCLVGLRIVLRSAGFVVESARTGADALALVAEDPADVLVLDLALPDGVGAALCAGVRRLNEVPTLILSSPGAQREKLLALNAGADDYVPKPFRRQELLDRRRGERGEDTRCLRVTVARLRAKLERDPWRSGYLVAEPGLGYRLCAPGEVIR
jgi:DNA-binding response OmpR family regulator